MHNERHRTEAVAVDWRDIPRKLKSQYGGEMPTDTGELMSFREFIAQWPNYSSSVIRICDPEIISFHAPRGDGSRVYLWVDSTEIDWSTP